MTRISESAASYNQREAHALVRRYAFGAAAAAAGASAVPAPIGVAVDLMGFDPVRSIQIRMIRELSLQCGRDLSPAADQVRRSNGAATRGQRASLARRISTQLVTDAVRYGGGRAMRRFSSRVVPFAGACVEAGLAFRATQAIGAVCLAALASAAATGDDELAWRQS